MPPSDEDRYPWERAESRWARASAAPVTHYEFVSVVEPIEKKLDVLYDRIEEVEERLIETRAKRALLDLVATAAGRITLLLLTLTVTIFSARFYGWP